MAAAAADGDPTATIRCQIVIIGAGMAGLSAASHLAKSGVHDFKILEARGRVGGRIFSLDTGRNQLELGANWIHGVLGNPLFELAMANGLVDISQSPRPHHVVAATERGQRMPFALLQETYGAYACFLRRCEEYFVSSFEPPPGVSSVGQHLRLEMDMYLGGDGCRRDDVEEIAMRRSLFACLLNRETCITGCHSMHDVDLAEMGSFREMQGGNISLPAGFGSLVAVVSRDLPPDSLLLRRVVSRLRWADQSHGSVDLHDQSDDSDSSDASDDTVTEVAVTGGSMATQAANDSVAGDDARPAGSGTEDGNETVECDASGSTLPSGSDSGFAVHVVCRDGTRVLANHAIVTLPLGVLKCGAELFSPALPPWKRAAVDRVGFGVVDKILLEFARPALPANVTEVLLLWDETTEAPTEPQESWVRKIYSFQRLTDTLLQGWISGKEAEFVETLPSKEVGAKCAQILRKFLDDPALPEPVNCVCSSWGRQEFSRGSYTAMALGSSQRDIDALARPLAARAPNGAKGLVLFAGEHTHRSFYSTAHGAFLSGRNAASRLVETLDQSQTQLSCDQLDLSSWIQGLAL